MDKATIQRLQKKLHLQRLQASTLQQENSQLQAKHAILSAYCGCLAWLRNLACSELLLDEHEEQQQQQGGLPMAMEIDLSTPEELLLLQELEQYLPAQQHGDAAAATAAAGRGVAAAAATADGSMEDATVSPEGDVLALFRRVYSMPMFPGAADMQLADAAAVYNELVRELSLNLTLHTAHVDHPTPMRLPLPGKRPPLDNIRAAFDKYFNMIASLNQLHSQNGMLMSMGLVNYADPSAELLPEHNLQQHIQHVRLVGLSAQQQQQIAAGWSVFVGLMDPVLQELRQLQLETDSTPGAAAAAAAADEPSAGTSDPTQAGEAAAADEAAAAAGGASSMTTMEGYKAHREALHQQEQRAAQLQRLLQKDMLIKAAFVCYTFGRFKYSQLAKLHVTMYPWQPNHGTVVRAVMKIMEEDAALQQQQQQKQPRDGTQQLQQLLPPLPHICGVALVLCG
ncbi:hypothetical protein OEZ85_000304 [Tetradesmus obliquus]|uniref:Uncharacterized protein n=1 Tax=Tetradesmus obliquus TaxID=3088 RepID=A0ABY8UPU6_TETOB|nr:hypothetical protein OEZ85_000304 [Tetradesmus obliquus]